MLDAQDREWFDELLNRKVRDIEDRFLGSKRAEVQREALASGNIPNALRQLHAMIEELTERVRKLESA